jgi:hypothetical protein
MNMDSSYLQYITSLMNDDVNFDAPAGHRRMSLGSYSDNASCSEGADTEECECLTANVLLFFYPHMSTTLSVYLLMPV